MATENERKFLVKDDSYKAEAYESIPIAQGYLSTVPQRTVRIRIAGDKAFITIKGEHKEGSSECFEWEKEIPVEEARELMALAEPGAIDKTRWKVKRTPAGSHDWEVDEFHGDNEGLVMAELELSPEDGPFDRPAWLGLEVTGDDRYYNAALSKNPYKNW
ncbi:MAG: CYTH domain-containing protein [Bacteroidales bacterium]|nr:CYTH domain-containing protein [Bacteroidales bacterium]